MPTHEVKITVIVTSDDSVEDVQSTLVDTLLELHDEKAFYIEGMLIDQPVAAD